MELGGGESLSSTPLESRVGTMKTFSPFSPTKLSHSFRPLFSSQSCPPLTNLGLTQCLLVQWKTFGSHHKSGSRNATKKKKATRKQTDAQTDLILCSLEKSGLRLVNFWASLQTVTMKKKTLMMMMRHTGPKKLQMRPWFRDSQQLVRKTENTCA